MNLKMLIPFFLAALASAAVRKHFVRLRRMARRDPETGLPNVRALLMALEKLARGGQRGDGHMLGVVTVYNSDEMSSAYGYGVMDESMQELAACAGACLPRGARVFRIGTEQIGLLVPARAEAMPAMLARLNAAFRRPLMHEGQPIHADARIGYVGILGFQDEPESYLRKAQAASLQASQSGHDIAVYRSGIRTRARDNLTILGEMIGGMEREELYLHYQPKVCLRSGAVTGAEALIRWKHPQRGPLAPGVFIPRAEQSTLIHALTEFALERALRQSVAWRAAGMCIPVAVNVSPRNLMQPGFCAIVERALVRCGAQADLLELEVTEGAMVGDVELVAAELHQLAALGVKIAIDDFGTGYCSLNYLDRLPASILKIDQSFIRRMLNEESSVDIVEAVVSVAHKKGVHIVAEGVESQELFDSLRQLGCDVAQGYAIGKPMAPAEFEAWYHAWQRGERPVQVTRAAAPPALKHLDQPQLREVGVLRIA
ncbi:MAG: bifunctional diguanylate cyclase/phosphodiesterase [Pseudomonadota bacterium]